MTPYRAARVARLVTGATLVGALCGAPAAASESLAARVERAAADAARARITAPDRLEVLTSRYGGADPIDPTAVRLEPAQVDGPNSLGVFRVRFRMTVDDLPRGEARATVRGRVHGPVLTASRTLVRGTPIQASDVEIVEADLTRLAARPLREADQALGRVPRRTLGVGRVMTQDLLAPAPVVRPGQLVELRIEQDRVTIRALGEALRTGAPGDVVLARNSVTGVKLEGIVQPDGSLLVLQHGGPRRW